MQKKMKKRKGSIKFNIIVYVMKMRRVLEKQTRHRKTAFFLDTIVITEGQIKEYAKKIEKNHLLEEHGINSIM